MKNKDKQTIERLKDTFYQNNAKGIKHFQKVTLYEEGIEDILSLLNMVEEKDKIINEQLKENVKLQSELNEGNNRCMILANNDKFKEQMIDLMTEIFYKRFKAELLLEYGFENEEQLKQYFAELVEKE